MDEIVTKDDKPGTDEEAGGQLHNTEDVSPVMDTTKLVPALKGTKWTGFWKWTSTRKDSH